MSTTVLVDDETHELLMTKQKELKKKYKMRINIREILQFAVKEGIGNVETQVVRQIEEAKKLDLENERENEVIAKI